MKTTRKQRTEVTPQLIGDIAREAEGKFFSDIKKKFWWISDTTLWKIMTENGVKWKMVHHPGTSLSSKWRKKKKMENQGDGKFFSFDDFRDSSGSLKIV